MHTVVDCHGHHLICNMLLLQLVGLLCYYGLHCVEPILYWRQMYHAMLWGGLFLTKKLWFLFYSISYDLFEFLFENEVECKSNNFYWHCIHWIKWNVKLLCFMTKQMDRHMSVVIALFLLFFLYFPSSRHPCNAQSNQEANEAAMKDSDAYDDTSTMQPNTIINW